MANGAVTVDYMHLFHINFQCQSTTRLINKLIKV